MTALDRVHIIGFCGPKQSGKDTAASFVRDIVVRDADSRDFQDSYISGTESFAGPMKSMVAMLLDFYNVGSIMDKSTLDPWLEGEFKETEVPGLGVSPRRLMQTLGTEWGRELVHPDIWLNAMGIRLRAYEEMRKHGYKGAVTCVTDVRFDNECDLIHELGGKIIEITRPEFVYNPDHMSEAGVQRKNIDEVFSNAGSLQDLYDIVGTYLWDTLQIPVTIDAEESVEDEPQLAASA